MIMTFPADLVLVSAGLPHDGLRIKMVLKFSVCLKLLNKFLRNAVSPRFCGIQNFHHHWHLHDEARTPACSHIADRSVTHLCFFFPRLSSHQPIDPLQLFADALVLPLITFWLNSQCTGFLHISTLLPLFSHLWNHHPIL